jgi:hypothetical protein
VKVFCGIDWAEGDHDIAVIDDSGQLIAKRRISETVTGIAELTDMFAAAGDSAEDPIAVAIETPRGLLVAAQRGHRAAGLSGQPDGGRRYRECRTVSRGKSDHADAMTLANILRTDQHVHRQLPADTNLAQAIAVLARALQDATWPRTKGFERDALTAARVLQPAKAFAPPLNADL